MRAENTLIDFPSKANSPKRKRLVKKNISKRIWTYWTHQEQVLKKHTKTQAHTHTHAYVYNIYINMRRFFSWYFFPMEFMIILDSKFMAPPERKNPRCSSSPTFSSDLPCQQVWQMSSGWTSQTYTIHGAIIYHLLGCPRKLGSMVSKWVITYIYW